MSKFYCKILIFLVIQSAFIQQVSGQTGSIEGYVYNEKSGQGIPGVNVLLENTFIGSATDRDGKFRIEHIPVGQYYINAQMIGFKSARTPVNILPDSVLIIEISMKEQALRTPEITVTATRRALSRLESPVSITAVSGKDLMLRNPYSLETLMSYQPGIQMVREQVNIRGSSGYARGAGSRVIILVDDVPAISFDNGVIYWDALPVYTIKRLEIMKGPGSALYGSSALGGVINIITREISAKSPRTTLRVQAGYFSQPDKTRERWSSSPMYSTSLRANHERLIGRTGLRLGIGRNLSTGYYQGGWYEKNILDGKIERKFANNKKITSRFYLIDDVHGAYTQWKDAAHRFHTPEDSRDDRTFTRKLHYVLSYKSLISPVLSSVFRGQYYQTHFRNEIHNNHTKSTARTLLSEWQIDYQPGKKIYLISGIQAKINDVSSTIWGGHKGLDAALFSQVEYKPAPRFSTTLGARYDVHQIDDNKVQSELNPKLGLNYKLSDKFTIRASAGRAFRAPSIAELYVDTQQGIFEVKPNPRLRSETAFAYELGCLYKSANLEADFAVYDNRYFHLIEPVQDPADGKIHFKNITKASIKGLEVSVTGQLKIILPIWNQVSYSYMNPRDLSGNRPLSYRHEHTFQMEQKLKLSDEFLFGWTYRYMSRIKRVELFEENSRTGSDERVPIHLVDIYLKADLSKTVSMTIAINNLFQYYYTTVERNMGPLREVTISLQYLM